MHGEIDASGGQSLFDLLRKHALRADLGQGDVGDFVARGVDDFNFNLMSAGAQQRGDMVGLPESELGTAGADAELGGITVPVHCFIAELPRHFRAGLSLAAASRLAMRGCWASCLSTMAITTRKFVASPRVVPN